MTIPHLHLLELTAAAAEADARLTELSPAQRHGFAQRAQEAASARGLMRGSSEIPLVLSPVSLPREELSALGRAARLLVSALVKVARDVIEHRPVRGMLLFAHLSPLEHAALATQWRAAEELLVARVDWFVDRGGHPKALEVNSTIPAMQVYSDAAAQGWLFAQCGESGSRLAERNPSNASWLLDTFLGAAQAAGRGDPRRPFPQGLRVQLLHREGDPQRTELVGLAERLRARGAEATCVTPADVVLDKDVGRALYRHLFARHVAVDSDLGRAFLEPAQHAMWNRVNGWLETKGLVGELSAHVGAKLGAQEAFPRAPGEGTALLSPEECGAVRELLPWTRLLDDVSDAELADGDRIVLKRSHDYGGKSVLIGREAGPARFVAAVEAARREQPGTWVAQELVDAPSQERWFCAHGPKGERFAQRAPLHLDISTYASLLPHARDGGSVCRAAPGRIVNIVGGGGVAPLFADDVLAEALSRSR